MRRGVQSGTGWRLRRSSDEASGSAAATEVELARVRTQLKRTRKELKRTRRQLRTARSQISEAHPRSPTTSRR